MFLLGILLFGTSSLCCGIAPTIEWLIGFRVLQGVGAAILNAVSLAIISATFPVEKRNAAIGVWGALAGLASAVGPVTGDFLVHFLSWHWIFFVNLPMCLISFILVIYFVPETRDTSSNRSIDFAGLALLTTSLVSLLITIGQGSSWGWTVPITLIFALWTALALLLFVLVERRQANPLVDFGLFRHQSFRIACLVIFLFSAVLALV